MGKNQELTVESLGLLAAERADMLVDDGTGIFVWSDQANASAILAQINFELAALWDHLINSNEDYCIFRKFIDVRSGQEDYPLPPDFYKLRKVFPIQSGKRSNALKRFDLKDLGASDSLAALLTSPIEDTRYKVTGLRLWLHPVPSSAAQLELWYIPQFDIVQNGLDLVPAHFPFGWEEYVVEGLAAKMLEKEESDASAQKQRQKEILQRILILAEDRDVGEPHKMQDTEGYLDSFS